MILIFLLSLWANRPVLVNIREVELNERRKDLIEMFDYNLRHGSVISYWKRDSCVGVGFDDDTGLSCVYMMGLHFRTKEGIEWARKDAYESGKTDGVKSVNVPGACLAGAFIGAVLALALSRKTEKPLQL